MSLLLEKLANSNPTAIALESKDGLMSYGMLLAKVNHLALWLEQQQISSLSVYAENSIEWVIIDFACQKAGVIFTPIPLFFTPHQFENLITTAKPDMVLSDRALPCESIYDEKGQSIQGLSLTNYVLKAPASDISLPIGTSKITFTSGSTGTPKGVCLSIENQFNVATSLVDSIGLTKPRHLCLLPLPTLLENIAGVYSPLLAGGTVIIANDAERGFSGSRLVNPQQLLMCISKVQPDSLILVPELLQVLIHACEQGWSAPATLKFIAVGGSKVSSSLITKARALNLPVYQGYGLSECSSVVSLCTPCKDDIESTGVLLPHLSAMIEHGELVVEGNCFLGYVGDESSWYQKRTYTGDIAEIKQSKIYLTGRVKNIIINSFGRNISPEWVESEVLACGLFQQAVLIGDAKPFCLMILVPINSEIPTKLIEQAIVAINASLPDYAQIKAQIVLEKPMQFEAGLYTSNGRPKRDAIGQYFKSEIDSYYVNSSSNNLFA